MRPNMRAEQIDEQNCVRSSYKKKKEKKAKNIDDGVLLIAVN